MTDVLHNPALVPPGVAGPAPTGPASTTPPAGALQGPAFAEVLREHVGTVSFSNHAIQRVQRRNIQLDGATIARLESGVERAAGKGARDSVVFVDGTAFVVSIKNKTVITAVDREHMREHVFTNIDSAVIA